MSQLVVQPGRNAARQAKKLKEIRKVERAITWSQRERKKRQTLHQERWDSKQAVLQRVRWDNKNVKEVRETALKNAKEDWKLGNLRPNRAIGDEVDKYGALTGEQIQKPEIPVHTQRNRNEARLKRGLEPIYPLVVDDMKYFHVVTGDRVVVVNGREKGKMGVVRDVIERTHEVIVAGVNMVCTTPSSEDVANKPSNTTTRTSSAASARTWAPSARTKCPSPSPTCASSSRTNSLRLK
jgi:large subunit ribosomal protein L24